MAERILHMNHPATDYFLIEQILQGDKKKFEILYKRYSRMIHLVCLRYAKTSSEAEDFLQDSFVSIFKGLDKYDLDKGNFSTWSKKVAVNVCLQHLRKKSFSFYLGNLTEIVSPQSNDPTPLDNLSLQELTKKIQTLPTGYRAVFNMFIIDGFSHKEIAVKLGITESSSRSQLTKAKKYLRGQLSHQNYKVTYG